MSNISAQALEDAANIATEFVYSLENLPNEVRHLCEEIKILDNKVYDLQTGIEAECSKYIALAQSPGGVPPNVKPPTAQKVQTVFLHIQEQNQQKVILAHKLAALLVKTRNRLDLDISKVRRLQGEPPLPERDLRASMAAMSTSAAGFTFGQNAASAISESLRSAMTPSLSSLSAPPAIPEARPPPVTAAIPTAATPAGNPTKKRKVTASTPTLKLPGSRSMSPVATPKPPAASHSARQSRLSRQIHPPPPPEPVHVEPEEDAEAEEEGDEGEEDDAEEDNKPYCFCQKKSFGDMIACDGSNCPYEWFHLSCVGLKPGQLDEGAQWFCEVCKKQMQGQGTARRRKR